MAILVAIAGWEADSWLAHFRAIAGNRRVGVLSDFEDREAIRYVCAWKPPHGLLASLPNLRAIFSVGAGVDHLMGDPSLPDVPIVRIVDADLTQRMTESVVLHVLLHHRRFKLYDRHQRERVWSEESDPAASEVRVGIMGLGVLGRAAALALTPLGFQLAGWSRSPKDVPGIKLFSGSGELGAFLARSDILVCLLPLTDKTRGILSYALFQKLAQDGALGGPALINAGRGGLQIEADILRALDEGVLTGASLDVFKREPLPADSPFWTHPKVFVTPHNAAQSDSKKLTQYMLNQIERLERGLPLENVVDRKRGY